MIATSPPAPPPRPPPQGGRESQSANRRPRDRDRWRDSGCQPAPGRAATNPAAPPWRGAAWAGPFSSALRGRGRGVSPWPQYGSSPVARKVRPRHSNLMPARLITSPHLAESEAINAANSSGVPPAGSSPVEAKWSLKAADWIALLIAALSLSTIGRGTPAGAMTPLQVGAE